MEDFLNNEFDFEESVNETKDEQTFNFGFKKRVNKTNQQKRPYISIKYGLFSKIFDGKISLSRVCEKNNIKLVKRFIQNGADVNKTDSLGETPLHKACEKNNTEIVNLLLPFCTKKTINKANVYGRTPLYFAFYKNYWACYKNSNSLEIVKLLLSHCTKETINKAVNKANDNGKTSLYWAYVNNNTEMVKLLLPYCTKETIDEAELLYRNSEKKTMSKVDEDKKSLSEDFFTKHRKRKWEDFWNFDFGESVNKTKDGQTFNFGFKERVNKNNQQKKPYISIKYGFFSKIFDGKISLSRACKNNNIEMVKLLVKNKTKVFKKYIKITNNQIIKEVLDIVLNLDKE